MQVPGNPTTWIFGVARALGRESELQSRGWHTPADTQGQDEAIRTLMQAWAGEYESVQAFEQALDSARIPLGTVKPVSSVLHEPWAQHRQALARVDVNGAPRYIPRSPVRFSAAATGPRRGSYLRGADNREVLQRRLGLSEAELDRLTAAGVLQEEPPPA